MSVYVQTLLTLCKLGHRLAELEADVCFYGICLRTKYVDTTMFGHLSPTGIPWRYKKRLFKAYRNCTSDLIGNIRVVCDQMWGNVLGQDFKKAKDYRDRIRHMRIEFERLWYVKRRLAFEGISARKSNTGFAPKKSNIGKGSATEHNCQSMWGRVIGTRGKAVDKGS